MPWFVLYTALTRDCLAVFGETGREAVVGLGSPYFQSREGGAGLLNVTTQLEAATYLHCRVNRLGGKTVSWEMF